jgi:hypothetical protein
MLIFFELFLIISNPGTVVTSTIPYVEEDHISSIEVSTIDGSLTLDRVILSISVFLSIFLLSVLLLHSYSRKIRSHRKSIDGVSNLKPVSKIRIFRESEIELLSILENLSYKTKSILIDDLILLLKLKTRKRFFKWFSELPSEIDIELQDNSIEFKNTISLLHLRVCPICKGNISFQEKVGLCQNCHYFFHHSHISQWLRENPSCPVCLNKTSKPLN